MIFFKFSHVCKSHKIFVDLNILEVLIFQIQRIKHTFLDINGYVRRMLSLSEVNKRHG